MRMREHAAKVSRNKAADWLLTGAASIGICMGIGGSMYLGEKALGFTGNSHKQPVQEQMIARYQMAYGTRDIIEVQRDGSKGSDKCYIAFKEGRQTAAAHYKSTTITTTASLDCTNAIKAAATLARRSG